jgi:hypothetical protein|tara:strand:- start:839 stop:1303 length:465 start_codon:yes stop_codon:yes gene_type:complete
MPGRPIIKAAYKALSGLGEQQIFETYLEVRNVKKMLAKIKPKIGHVSVGIFYAWLHSDKSGERWDRWQQNKKIIGSSLVEEGLDIVDDADDGSVQAARLKAEQRRWMAERYNRTEYGKQDATVNVVSIGNDFLNALKQVEKESSDPDEIIQEED